MKKGILGIAMIVVIAIICAAGIYFVLTKNQLNHIHKIMKIVYRHDPRFGKNGQYPKVTRIIKQRDQWLVYNAWDFRNNPRYRVLDGASYMVIHDGNVISYLQGGQVDIFLSDPFYCCKAIDKLTKALVFDETGKRTGCIDIRNIPHACDWQNHPKFRRNKE